MEIDALRLTINEDKVIAAVGGWVGGRGGRVREWVRDTRYSINTFHSIGLDSPKDNKNIRLDSPKDN